MRGGLSPGKPRNGPAGPPLASTAREIMPPHRNTRSHLIVVSIAMGVTRTCRMPGLALGAVALGAGFRVRRVGTRVRGRG